MMDFTINSRHASIRRGACASCGEMTAVVEIPACRSHEDETADLCLPCLDKLYAEATGPVRAAR